MMEIRKPYKPRTPSPIVFRDDDGIHDGITEQHHKPMCDVNNIIRQYDKTGLIEHVAASKASYGDFTQVNEYQESLNMVIRAQNAFDELPSAVRKRFGNDPGEFFEFATNPDNQEEMVKLGLAERIQEPKPAKVEVVNQEPATGDKSASE